MLCAVVTRQWPGFPVGENKTHRPHFNVHFSIYVFGFLLLNTWRDKIAWFPFSLEKAKYTERGLNEHGGKFEFTALEEEYGFKSAWATQ